jgi:hypothetical protein
MVFSSKRKTCRTVDIPTFTIAINAHRLVAGHSPTAAKGAVFLLWFKFWHG